MNTKRQITDHERRLNLLMQLRMAGIQDMAVLGAMESVPRDEFVPPAVKHQAWEDMALPIGRGQTISQPYIVALMTSALELTKQDKVLEIGTGCGYQTSVLSKLCRRVYSIERHKPLLLDAEKRLHGLGILNITLIAADGMKGWPKINGMDQAPFDKIIVTAAAKEKPPQAMMDQLKVGGLLVIPLGENPSNQILRRYKKESADTFAIKDLCAVRFVPLLPDVENE